MSVSTARIRSQFLDYFASREHRVLPSGPLVPSNDPTLMFTNAGMVQFKEAFTGRRRPPAPRAATAQKCIRISGKHNDLENVGRTSRHHTFFEMLGNFSFGDYFKEDACRFGWELLHDVLGLDADRLWVSVFAGGDEAPADEEAVAIWRDRIGVPEERILRGDAADNFWAMGDTGPCGPCSEIMYDRGERFGEARLENGERFFELWNLVFMQYLVDTRGGEKQPLPAPCIDTGAGLERIASVLQGVDSNYDTDIFKPLISSGEAIANKRYGDDPENDVSLRVISDHARMTAHLISEGVFPEKSGREYVLRRVMRRAIRHGHRLGIDDLFLHLMTRTVVETMGEAYPELVERRELIDRVCRQEEERFRATLGRGLELLERNESWKGGGEGRRILPGELAFDLSATYGFPLDLIEVIGREQGFVVDEQEFAAAEERHRAVSGAGKIGESEVLPVYSELRESLGGTRFTGYESDSAETQVLAVVRDGRSAVVASQGDEVEIVLAETPFYGEAGGQVGDTGLLRGRELEVAIDDTRRPLPDLWVHVGRVRLGRLRPGDEVSAAVDAERRAAIRRHHTATHLMHWALRTVLGAHATQKGSQVAPEILRFDVAHFEPIRSEQLREIERLVSERIVANLPVQTREMSFDEARESGAMAIFEENYGDVVRLVEVGEIRELCGGTHVGRSGDIGPFFVVSESGVSAGVRRIEAVAGLAAARWAADRRRLLEEIAARLRCAPDDLPVRVDKMLDHERELGRELDRLKLELASGSGGDLAGRAREVEGVRVVGARLGVGDPRTMRETADTLRQRLGSAVICLAGENKGKAAVLVALTEDLTERLDARKLVRQVAAKVGGGGGGRVDLAQAGGPDAGGLDAAVDEIYSAVARAVE